MELRLTEDALELIRERGGRMALDFLPPVG